MTDLGVIIVSTVPNWERPFYNGSRWVTEFPDAWVYSSVTEARKVIKARGLKEVKIVQNYGLETEFEWSP